MGSATHLLVALMRVACVALAATLGACGISDPAPAEIIGCVAGYADVEQLAVAEIAAAPFHDAALVVRVDGQTVCRLFFGDYEPTTPVLTVSAAKWLTAATLLAVIDRTQLRLDTRMAELFPNAPAATAGITVSQLLSHTSGLLWFSRCMGRNTETLQSCAETILASDLHFEPGTGFFYSGPPFTVAGALAERVMSATWADIFSTTIAGPLGMSNTTYGDSPNPALSEGAVVSTVDDYARFAQMILDNGVYAGRRILSEDAINQMRRDWTQGVTVQNSPREGVPYGLGAWLDATDSNGFGVVLSSPGIGGFVPVVDYPRRMVFVFEAEDQRMWDAINAILAGVRTAVDRER